MLKSKNLFLLSASVLILLAAKPSLAQVEPEEPILINPTEESVSETTVINQPEAVIKIDTKSVILNILEKYTLGTDENYKLVISPSKSLNLQLSESDRTAEINQKISTEFATLIDLFNSTPDDEKSKVITNAAKQFDTSLKTNNSAHIEFIDGNPSGANARVLLLIEKNENSNLENAINSFISYKRSAKPSDFSYEYENAFDLTQGSIREVVGSDSTWQGNEASLPLIKDENVVLKKCRQIFGWRCITSLYTTSEYVNADETLKYVFMGNYDLSKNSDNKYFSKDKRTVNQVAGSTALYVFKESEKWILILGFDGQWNKGGLSFTSIIQDEYQKDFTRMTKKLKSDLK